MMIRSRRMLDIDLNVAPPFETPNHDAILNRTGSSHRLPTQGVTITPIIDVDVLDDDVGVYSSLRTSDDNSHRRSRIPVVNLESGNSNEMSNSYTRRRVPTNPKTKAESSSIYKRKRVWSGTPPPLPPPPPKEAIFICPVCLCSISNEMSTKCGHIFCKRCIKATISRLGNCPVCRKELTAQDIFRVYLPATKIV